MLAPPETNPALQRGKWGLEPSASCGADSQALRSRWPRLKLSSASRAPGKGEGCELEQTSRLRNPQASNAP